VQKFDYNKYFNDRNIEENVYDVKQYQQVHQNHTFFS